MIEAAADPRFKLELPGGPAGAQPAARADRARGDRRARRRPQRPRRRGGARRPPGRRRHASVRRRRRRAEPRRALRPDGGRVRRDRAPPARVRAAGARRRRRRRPVARRLQRPAPVAAGDRRPGRQRARTTAAATPAWPRSGPRSPSSCRARACRPRSARGRRSPTRWPGARPRGPCRSRGAGGGSCGRIPSSARSRCACPTPRPRSRTRPRSSRSCTRSPATWPRSTTPASRSPTADTWRLEENRWSAARWGMDAELADLRTGARTPVRELLAALVAELAPAAARLGCTAELADVAAAGGRQRRRAPAPCRRGGRRRRARGGRVARRRVRAESRLRAGPERVGRAVGATRPPGRRRDRRVAVADATAGMRGWSCARTAAALPSRRAADLAEPECDLLDDDASPLSAPASELLRRLPQQQPHVPAPLPGTRRARGEAGPARARRGRRARRLRAAVRPRALRDGRLPRRQGQEVRPAGLRLRPGRDPGRGRALRPRAAHPGARAPARARRRSWPSSTA